MSNLKLSYSGWFMLAVGAFLLGYGLSASVRLNHYFYSKPFADDLIDVVLVSLALFCAFRWLKGRAHWLIIVIPFLCLSWLRVDYLLFSKSYWFSAISYAYIAFWALSFVALWQFIKRKLSFVLFVGILVLALSVGLIFGLRSSDHVLPFILAVVFVLVLPWAGESPFSGRRVIGLKAALLLFLSPLLIWYLISEPQFFESQKNFEDKVVYSRETRFQQIDVTEWKGNYWFYQDGINQFSSIDSWLYFEPFVHPVMQLAPKESRVLIVGGENGMLARTLAQYESVDINLLPLDVEYLELARTEPFFIKQHQGVFKENSAAILKGDIYDLLSKNQEPYDVIFVDLPDPIDVELNQYYTKEFYKLCKKNLTENGFLVTQSGSPYFATAAFQSIEYTMYAASFEVVSYHNQILTLGEWAWTIGSKQVVDMEKRLRETQFDNVATQWLNQEAMQMMLSFGKPHIAVEEVKINTIANPVIHRYYLKGNYQFN